MSECPQCRDWGKYERHEDHWPPVEHMETPEEDPNCPVHGATAQRRPTCPECGGPSINTGRGWIVCTKRGCSGSTGRW